MHNNTISSLLWRSFYFIEKTNYEGLKGTLCLWRDYLSSGCGAKLGAMSHISGSGMYRYQTYSLVPSKRNTVQTHKFASMYTQEDDGLKTAVFL